MIRTATIHLDAALLRVEICVRLKPTSEPVSPALTIDLTPVPVPYTQVSLSMGSWERKAPKGRWYEASFGQGRSLILESLESFGLSEEKQAAVRRLCELWERWHLNDLKADTRAQGEALTSPDFHPSATAASHYDEAVRFLTERGLNPDKGYKYGSAWLVEVVPDEVLTELGELCRTLGAGFSDSSDE